MFVWLRLTYSCIGVQMASCMGHLWWGSPSLYIDPWRLESSGEALVIYPLWASQREIHLWRAALGANRLTSGLYSFASMVNGGEFVNMWVRYWRGRFKNSLLHQTRQHREPKHCIFEEFFCSCIFKGFMANCHCKQSWNVWRLLCNIQKHRLWLCIRLICFHQP